ncbi:DUF221-domain-containing protein [Obba rivulosa]|uniref:DUF221-domain-containing protein n=1 Tax=Obba rivulosa TaxID=1052685 RepID=A0A8E2B2E4_9APHY|nr:DUF221-domain-containing protein [Obba rivulosa]
MSSALYAPFMTAYSALWAYDDEPGLPPGTPPTRTFEGPWFTTQLVLSSTVGIISFLLFSYCRTRWPLAFAPRTKLKGFSPHEAHSNQSFFGWIIPTIRTSEFAVLQIVGLDAAVLLSFYKMCFWLFSTCSVLAVLILMPVNLKNNIDIGDGSDDDGGWRNTTAADPTSPPSVPSSPPSGDWLDLVSDANSYLSVHLLFTYLFTLLSLYFIHKNFHRFIRARQLFSLELVHSVAARTVMITHVPLKLRSERALAEYFEHMDMHVENVSVCREVGSLKQLLDKRTEALKKLEGAWVKYMGNPCVVDGRRLPQNGVAAEGQPEIPGRRRPTLRPGWFKPKLDAIDHLDERFKEADEMVRKRRRSGKFKATHVAFVTFDKMSSAQIAAQSVLAPSPTECLTHPAPEPRDIIWSAVSYSPASLVVREWIVFGVMGLLLFFWLIPITALASLLSYKEIKKTMPWLGELIDKNQQIRAIVQNSLPSVAIVMLNALLPLLLEGLTYIQGFPARSWIEYSLLKKYFLFLLVHVVFIFLVASTYWQLVRDLASSPAKGVEKLADALAAGQARHFFLSYVILQGLAIMPLQLLNLGVLVPRVLYRLFTRTPRDYAELNAPPMINYGVVYPQSILIFVITLLYSVIQPLILIFGAVYFGVAYLVYKYKLLFVFYKPYESQGQAWPITFARLIWGVVIFNVFMIGIFILKKAYISSSLVAPLLAGTVLWSWSTYKRYRPLSKYVNLSSVFEVERGEDSADVMHLRSVHPVSWSQSNLNRRRYGQNDETLYVAPEDERTDYSQPPMANWYGGVLNTGKRRYGHPALNGILPTPWLPRKKILNENDTILTRRDTRDSAVVLTLRKRYSKIYTNGSPRSSGDSPAAAASETPNQTGDLQANPWSDTSRVQPSTVEGTSDPQLNHRLSFDLGSGVIALPEESMWLEDDHDSDSDDVGELTVNEVP